MAKVTPSIENISTEMFIIQNGVLGSRISIRYEKAQYRYWNYHKHAIKR